MIYLSLILSVLLLYLQVDAVDLDDVPNVIGKYHICVVKNYRLDAALIAKAAQMKLLMQFGVGLEGQLHLPHVF